MSDISADVTNKQPCETFTIMANIVTQIPVKKPELSKNKLGYVGKSIPPEMQPEMLLH